MHAFSAKSALFKAFSQADQEINGIKHFMFVYAFTPPHEWRDQKKEVGCRCLKPQRGFAY
ncbi:MAG: hypothetical protein EA401_04695 [Planctomycetota bacterium]|nr:MAG: hypothetical protein EA401_04695 [Planctomycetota bacterium]